MMKQVAIALLLGLWAWVSTAASPAFEPVPAGANRALKAIKGKPIHTGLVFVNGHYVKPPYTIMRSGTALFLNYNTQITSEIVPWTKFLATQPGYEPEESESEEPAPAASPAAVQSIDDLFADNPAPLPAAKPVARAKRVATVVDDNAPFEHNDKSRVLLKRINDTRSYIDRKLREGNLIFFGSRYPRVNLPPRIARELMAVLPEEIRDASDGENLEARLRAKGIAYLRLEVCEDLIANRQDYLKLLDRRSGMKREYEVQSLIEQGSR